MSKTALVIGGSSGIGLATVKKLASKNFNIFILHRDRRLDAATLLSNLQHLSDEYKVNIKNFNTDATNIEKIENCTAEMSAAGIHFDLVVHAVSRGNLKPFIGDNAQLSPQDMALTIDAMGTNFHVWVAKLLDKQLIVKGTRIIALTSEGNKKFWEGYGAVASAKAVLENIANYLAVELAKKGISVNTLQAGVTDTPSLRLIPGAEKLMKETIERNPFGRMTSPEDVANCIYLLSLPEAGWINGALIHVDGGEHLI